MLLQHSWSLPAGRRAWQPAPRNAGLAVEVAVDACLQAGMTDGRLALVFLS